MAALSTLCSPYSAAAPSSFLRETKFPAKYIGSRTVSTSTLGLRAGSVRAMASDASASGDSDCGWNRRGVLLSAAFPFLLPPCDSLENWNMDAKAGESAKSEYEMMKEEIRKVVPKGRAAGVLRLVFHDAGTFEVNDKSGGMNGSILFELERFENTGLKFPLKILEKAKRELDAIKPVSWADMIAVGGAEAVSICGGPVIPVKIGRLDSSVADPEGKLPEETLGPKSLKESFQRKGFSTQELVALSGAHTLGSKGFGNSDTFDNAYFKILIQKPWKSGGMTGMVGLPSDRSIAEDDECLRWITKYAENQDSFFEDFGKAYTKLVDSGAKWRSS